ncbi:MAG: aminopeptidase [Chitinispirillales bacterium]|jgi:predicted aminopeptidase|nr:aminopeptidase [Chitinispirillales bacterium]
MRAIRAILVLFAFLLFNGCYLGKQGAALMRQQLSAKSMDKMLKKDNITPEMKEFFLLVREIKSFAMDSIGLKRNKNYRNYVKAERDYIVDVVTASRDDAFESYKWWFPILGNVSYKGFFDRKDAQKEAARIIKKGGYDVHIGAASAFSTLGFFSDPVYSFMINYSVYDLASLIIHEQMHATVYIKSQTQLSEEMATFIGDEGGLLFVKKKFGENSDQYKTALLSKEDYAAYISLMRSLYNELKTLYESNAGREYKLAQKELIISRFKNGIIESYDSLFHTPRYRGLERASINNANIAARMTYNKDLVLFYELYVSRGMDLAETVRELRALKKVKKNHKEYLRKRIQVNTDF